MIKKVLIAIVGLFLIMMCFLAYDIYQDRQNKIIFTGTVPVYADWEPYPKDQQPILILSTEEIVKVKRIRYGKDYMAILVETQNGQSGWIFSGYSFNLTSRSNK